MSADDRVRRARAIADAVLYEGYVLYPYRPSSLKNRQRWSFGGLLPRAHCAATGAEPWQIHCELLLEASAEARVSATVRFLHPVSCARGDATWSESIERTVELEAPCRRAFGFEIESSDTDTLRTGARVEGEVELSVERVSDALARVRLRVANVTPVDPVADPDPVTLASTHALLTVDRGAFVSSQDPPPGLAVLNDACETAGLWPVLVGERGARDVVLASPIILYDHPEIAEESPTSYFDGTEIDEMLALRVLTMTDAEQREMASGDPRVGALLERTLALGPDELARLHGRLRRKEPISLAVGDRVRVAPSRLGSQNGGGRADCFDAALDGKLGEVVALEHDLEGRAHVAITIDDDPGRDLGAEGKPGHRFFFHPSELAKASERDRVLVAGLGNVFLGDDGFGVEVASLLRKRPQKPGVRVVDFGVRAFDLGVALANCDAAILVDATRRGGAPGTLYAVELELAEGARPRATDGHGLDPDAVIASLPVEERPRVVRLVGCEPETFGDEDEGQLGLSPTVARAVEQAAAMVEAQVESLLAELGPSGEPGAEAPRA